MVNRKSIDRRALFVAGVMVGLPRFRRIDWQALDDAVYLSVAASVAHEAGQIAEAVGCLDNIHVRSRKAR